jgi:ASC-1-like (ASCH) protein
MKVKINKYRVDEVTKRKVLDVGRQEVEVEVIKENMKTVWVKLPDGKVINRKRRDIVSYEKGVDKAS